MSDWESAGDGWESSDGWETSNKKGLPPLLSSSSFSQGNVPEVRSGKVVRQPENQDTRSIPEKIVGHLKGSLESNANLLTGLAAFPIGMLGGMASGEENWDKTGGAMDRIIHKLQYQPVTEEGQKYSDIGGDFINRNLIPLAGLHLSPSVSSKLGKGVDAKAAFDRIDPGPLPEETPPATTATSPQVMNVTREGQAYPADTEMWRSRADEMTNKAREGETDLQPGPTPYDPYFPNGLQRLQDYKEAGMEYPFNKDALTQELNAPKAGEPLPASKELLANKMEADGPVLAPGKVGSENLAGPMGAPPDVLNIGMRRGQGGAIDIQGIMDGVEKLKDRLISSYSYLGKWKGAFDPVELEKAQAALFDPSSKDTIVLMHPDMFHELAFSRSKDPVYSSSGDARRSSVREGLSSDKGLNEIPYLTGTIKDGVFSVNSHNGRHRMDVFKENGLEAVPVRLRVDTRAGGFKGWGKEESTPHTIEGETGQLFNFPDTLTFKGMPSYKKNQQGALDMKSFVDGIDRLFNKPMPLPVTKAEFLAKQPGMGKDMEGAIPRGPAAESAIPLMLKDIDSKTDTLWKNMQSGLTLTADKVNSSLMLFTGRWIQYAQKRGEFDIRNEVAPLEKSIRGLDSQQLQLLQEGLKRAQSKEKQFTPEQLKQTGMKPDVIKLYEDINKGFDKIYEKQVAMQQALGEKPMTREEAYYSSIWHGDYHALIKNKDGKPVWYIQTYSRSEGKAALEYLKKNFPDLPLDKVKMENRANKIDPNTPKDVIGAYQDMMKYFTDDPATTALMKEALEEYAKDRGYASLGQDKHFREKMGIRGFEGDRPWLSDKQNAINGMKAQLTYLKNAYKWVPMQEALTEIKKVMSNEDLIKAQPNNMELAKAHVARQLGLSPNVLKGIENGVAELLGTSRAKLYVGVNDLKSVMYLQQLGLSGGYMIGTPLQGLISVPAWNLKLSGEGFRLNPAKALKAYGSGIIDATSIFSEHYYNHYKELIKGEQSNFPMSNFGRKAKDYAENNSVWNKNLFDENSPLGEHEGVNAVKNIIGGTISTPEKLVRVFSFLSFAHHLKETGKFLDDVSLFQRAEELTNNALTDFRSSERPMVVDKLGTAGQLSYTYHSFLFNMFNNMSMFIRQKNYAALTGMVATMVYLGGLMDLPFMNEADGIWNIFKNVVAEWMPDKYDIVQGPGLKGSILSMKDQALAHGHVSTALGWEVGSRFSPNIIDPENPLQSAFPMLKTGSNSIPKTLNPTKTDMLQYIHDNAPAMVKGNMENHLDAFKGPQRGDKHISIKPSNISSGEASYARDEKDRTARMWGATSLKESDARSKDFIAQNENKRQATARKENLDQVYNSIINKNPDRIKQYASAYFRLGGTNEGLNQFLQTRAEKSGMTMNEWLTAHGTSLTKIQDLKSRKDMGNMYNVQ